MSFRNISAWSIRNPVPPIVLFIVLTLAGIVSFMRMEVNNDPDIDFPVVIVTISQPGAAPTELETQVTQKVEAAVRSLSGRRRDQLDRHRRQFDRPSSSSRSARRSTARSTTCATRSQQIRGDLPDGILEPQVEPRRHHRQRPRQLCRDHRPT